MEEKIIEIIKSDIINLSDKTIKNLYNYWRDETEDKCKSDPKDWIQKKELISETQQVPKGSYLNGIDFPYWFGNENSETKIMIMGIDSLRNESDFCDFGADCFDDVIIGTPYALHSKKMRCGRTKEYWKFINTLSNNNFVYLTDIHKTFFFTDKTKKRRSYVHYSSIDSKSARDIMKKEIELIKPDIIITLGNETFKKFTTTKIKNSITNNFSDNIINMNEFPGIPIIPMVHLSRFTFKSKVKFLEENLDDYTFKKGQGFGSFYAEVVEKYLNVNT